MKRFLASTATIMVMSTAAYAEDYTNTFSDMTFDQAVNLNASELIGMRVYATESDIENDLTVAADGEKEWDDIGEINEIVLTRAGEVQTVIVGVGGFLGIGEKDVAVDMGQIKFVSDGENADDFFLVVNASAAGVEEAPAYERTVLDAEVETQTDETVTVAQYDSRPMMTAPSVEREGYQTVSTEDLNTEDLTGARVYGPTDKDVGEISELLMTVDGKLDRAVIDVGGFLGMGERPVAVTLDELQIVRSDGGGSFRVYIDDTQEVLEQQPEYEG